MRHISSLIIIISLLLGLHKRDIGAALTPEEFKNNRLQMQLMRGFRIKSPELNIFNEDENDLTDEVSDADILAKAPMNEKTDFAMIRKSPLRNGILRNKARQSRQFFVNTNSDPYRSFSPAALRNFINP